jgi:ADP-heptose:LPS heptosyltransferase
VVEVLQAIEGCYFFIGPDSALYNGAFVLNKPTIGLFGASITQAFEHPYEHIKIVKGDGNVMCDKLDNYGSDVLNSISIEDIEKAIMELSL